jgi:uncharacterized protein YhfF
MRNIEPVQIWSNGQSKQASVLDARIINDDLKSSCSFYYELKEADTVTPSSEEGGQNSVVSGISLAQGNVSMSGQDYDNWDDSNDSAYQFIADHLNLTLIVE